MRVRTLKGLIAIFALALTGFLPYFVLYPTYKGDFNSVLDLPVVEATGFLVVFALPFILNYLPLAWLGPVSSESPPTDTPPTTPEEVNEPPGAGEDKPELTRRIRELEEENTNQRRELQKLKANQAKILSALRSILDSTEEWNQDEN